MDSNAISKNTAAWRMQTWLSFIISFGLMMIGIAYLPVDFWIKGYLMMGLIFTVGSCFSLAKTIRDDHESDRLINRINNAKTEKILKEFEN